MGNYENGSATRVAILRACFRLFLEKGYHETSYDDICKEAHVYRSAIYYHFKEKENIRYEVFWEIIRHNKDYVAKYCPSTRNSMFLAIYLICVEIEKDPRVFKFWMDYWKDYPYYSPRFPFGRVYYIAYEQMYGRLRNVAEITDLAFASIYGHLVGLFTMLWEYPQKYTSKEIIQHCAYAGTAVWEIPKDEAEAFWAEVNAEIDQLPLDDLPPLID